MDVQHHIDAGKSGLVSLTEVLHGSLLKTCTFKLNDQIMQMAKLQNSPDSCSSRPFSVEKLPPSASIRSVVVTSATNFVFIFNEMSR